MRQRVVSRAILVLVVVAIAGGAGWWFYGRGTGVRLVMPTRGTAAEIVYATGAIEPVRWARVTSLVRARILDLCFCEGRAVSQGDIVARLDDREPRAILEELQSRRDLARRELERQQTLTARGVTTAQAFDRASNELATVEAQIRAQRERLGNYVITSPIDGVVLRQDGQIGEVIDVGTTLFRIGETTPLQIVADVNEEDIPRVVPGQQVLVRSDAFRDRTLGGTVREITPAGDPTTKTYRVRIRLPDDTPLKVGMTVEANIVTRTRENALLVPAEAVPGDAVFTVQQNRAVRRAVTTGLRSARTVEITAGLADTDAVISPVPAGLADGVRVHVEGGGR